MSWDFDERESRDAFALIDMALEEDLGDAGDVTGSGVIPSGARGGARVVSRASGVLAGLPVVPRLLRRGGFDLEWEGLLGEGSRLSPGSVAGVLRGDARDLLAVERTLLNFLQRMSGVASLTARFVEASRSVDAGAKALVMDTRKTTPGWRRLEKYAVRVGGGTNHRMGLFDMLLVKDNHLAWLSRTGDAIGAAVEAARAARGRSLALELEVDSLEQLDRALELGSEIDVVLLDNFGLEGLREAVRRRDARAPGLALEASGGVNLETIGGIAATGVDRISVGALTHSAFALDLGLDYDE